MLFRVVILSKMLMGSPGFRCLQLAAGSKAAQPGKRIVDTLLKKTFERNGPRRKVLTAQKAIKRRCVFMRIGASQ